MKPEGRVKKKKPLTRMVSAVDLEVLGSSWKVFMNLFYNEANLNEALKTPER